MKNNDHLILRICEYGYYNQRFTLGELRDDVKLTDDEYQYVFQTLTKVGGYETDNPNHILVFAYRHPDQKIKTADDYMHDYYSILPTALFSYVDHLEIVEARKAAKEAKRLSWIAIWITLIIGIMQILAAI